jgi:hypothetical protein
MQLPVILKRRRIQIGQYNRAAKTITIKKERNLKTTTSN